MTGKAQLLRVETPARRRHQSKLRGTDKSAALGLDDDQTGEQSW